MRPLKPCPFCRRAGAKAVQHARTIWTVLCGHCEAEGPPKPTADEASQAWNERPAEAEEGRAAA